MADILDVITSRRTIKHFLPKFVSWENLARILDAGRHAPSCGNLQNWKFIVACDIDLKQKIAEACYQQYDVVPACALIVVCGEPEKAERYYGARGRFFTTQNCAAAIQNMLLEAHSLGLGTRWVGAFDEEELKLILRVPAEVTVEAVVALGHAQETPPKPPKFPLEPMTYFGRWRSRMRDPAKYLNDIASIMARKRAAAQRAVSEKISSLVGKAKEKFSKKEPPQ